MIHSIELKIKVSEDGHKPIVRILQGISDFVDKWEYPNLKMHPSVDLNKLKDSILETFGKDNISFRDGCLDGCYGSNTGRHLKGVTLNINAELFPDRIERMENMGTEDSPEMERCEYYNPVKLFLEHGKLIEDLDGSSFLDACEALGLEDKADNTYNYAEHGGEVVCPFYTVDFHCIQNTSEDSKIMVVAKFHYGGDPRGNYGNEYVFQFDTEEDLYSAIYPSWYGPEDC